MIRLASIRINARSRTWIVLFIVLAGSLQVINSIVANAIPIRQDPNMNVEGEFVVGINNITNVIEKLGTQFNDTILAKYRNEILSNASSGNFTLVNELLNELRTYLRSNYANKSLTEEEASEISLISSTNKVNSNAVSVNVTKALQIYAELMKNKELLKTLQKLNVGGTNSLTPSESEDLLNALSKIISVIEKSPTRTENFPQPPKQTSSQEGINFSSLYELPKLPTSLPVSKVSTKQLSSFKFLVITLFVLTVIAAAIYAILKIKPEATRSLKKYVVATFTKLTTRAGNINDPIIKVYALTLKRLELYGFKKSPYETPREFLNRIKIKEFRDVLEKLTSAYEVRAYSRRRLDEEAINELLKLVKKVVGPA